MSKNKDAVRVYKTSDIAVNCANRTKRVDTINYTSNCTSLQTRRLEYKCSNSSKDINRVEFEADFVKWEKLKQKTLFVVLHYYKKYGKSFPKIELIAAHLKCSPRTVTKYISELAREGVLPHKRRFNLSNVYTILNLFRDRSFVARLKMLAKHVYFLPKAVLVSSMITTQNEGVPTNILKDLNYIVAFGNEVAKLNSYRSRWEEFLANPEANFDHDASTSTPKERKEFTDVLDRVFAGESGSSPANRISRKSFFSFGSIRIDSGRQCTGDYESSTDQFLKKSNRIIVPDGTRRITQTH